MRRQAPRRGQDFFFFSPERPRAVPATGRTAARFEGHPRPVMTLPFPVLASTFAAFELNFPKMRDGRLGYA